MLKIFATTLLVSTTLATGALAQTSATPSGTSTAGASGSTFVTDQKAGEFRASKFVGVDIYGSENQKIGDINEILMDASGNAKAIVIGVGGFLGIGEKNVAVPFSAVEWKNERPTGDRTAGTTGGSGGTTGSTTAAGTMAGTTGTTTTGATGGTAGTTAGTTAITPPTGPVAGATTPAPATTASSGTTASAPVPSTTTSGGATMTGAPGTTSATGTTGANQSARSPAEMAAVNGYPDHGVVTMSKADLENAPTFRYYADANTANRGTNTTTGGATAPSTTTPRQ